VSLPRSPLAHDADTLKTVIALEREAWGLATAPDKPADDAPPDRLDVARRVAFMFARAEKLLPTVH